MHQLHHFAVRDFPEPDVGATRCPIHSWPRSASFRSTSRRTGWAFCNGQLMPISQNTALFSLLGTTYGGDGKIDLRASQPSGQRADAPGPGPRPVAARPRRDGRRRDGDAAAVSEMPAHSHALRASRDPADRPHPQHKSGAFDGCDGYQPSNGGAGGDVAPGAAACGRQPAAQQPEAVSDRQLLHRAAGRVPAEGMTVDVITRREEDAAIVLRPIRRPAVPAGGSHSRTGEEVSRRRASKSRS